MASLDIVVGVDDSDAAHAALRWAADEAARRRTNLRLVCVYPQVRSAAPTASAGDDAAEASAQHRAQAVLERAVAAAADLAPSVPVSGSAEPGSVASTLLRHARVASLLVVGGGDRDGFVDLLVGSVVRQVIAQATCPVIVVRGEPSHRGGPVVVGVNEAGNAVAAAFSAAAVRNVALLAVRAWSVQPPSWHYGPVPVLYDTVGVEAAEGRVLSEAMSGWCNAYASVDVRRRLVPGDAGHALVEASCGAQLLVVGNRRHGGLARLLFGSVSQHVADHAACPVLVMPSG